MQCNLPALLDDNFGPMLIPRSSDSVTPPDTNLSYWKASDQTEQPRPNFAAYCDTDESWLENERINLSSAFGKELWQRSGWSTQIL
jgi:hypothetical protein